MTMTESEWERVSLVPRRRLGALLSHARVAKGLTLDEVAGRAGDQFSTGTLASVERGTRDCSDAELRTLSQLYSLEATSLVPSRSQLVIDFDDRMLSVEDHHTKLGRSPRDREDVLSRYLAMVYSMRQVEPGHRIPLRVDDLDVLGRALHVGTQTLAADLTSLMSNPRDAVGWRSRALRRRVLIPAAGVLVAVCAAGSLVLVSSHSEGTFTHVSSTTQVAVAHNITPLNAHIGSAVVQVRGADGSESPVVTRGADPASDIGASVEASGDVGVSLIPPLVQERSAG